MFAEQHQQPDNQEPSRAQEHVSLRPYTRGTLTASLRTETRSAHDDIEEGNTINQILAGKEDAVRPNQVSRGEITAEEFQRRQEQYRDVYVAALKAQYGFEKALEHTLDESPFGKEVYDALGLTPPQPPASTLIAEDLKALGEDVPEDLMQLPHYSSISDALGALYVRMGSRMGGLIIAKNAELALGIDTANGGHYYGMYGLHTMKEFTSFLRALDTYTSDPVDVEQAVRSANNTFRAIAIWQQEVYERELPDLMRELRPNIFIRGLKALGRWFVQD